MLADSIWCFIYLIRVIEFSDHEFIQDLFYLTELFVQFVEADI